MVRLDKVNIDGGEIEVLTELGIINTLAIMA